MKRFDFRIQLKDMSLERLESFRNKHLDYMLTFMGIDEKEADKHSRYVGYIDDQIKRIKKQKSQTKPKNHKNKL